MYSGSMIDELIDKVREAEEHAFEAYVTEARLSAGARHSTYIYEFSLRDQVIGVA
jgi:hypothetical protein